MITNTIFESLLLTCVCVALLAATVTARGCASRSGSVCNRCQDGFWGGPQCPNGSCCDNECRVQCSGSSCDIATGDCERCRTTHFLNNPDLTCAQKCSDVVPRCTHCRGTPETIESAECYRCESGYEWDDVRLRCDLRTSPPSTVPETTTTTLAMPTAPKSTSPQPASTTLASNSPVRETSNEPLVLPPSPQQRPTPSVGSNAAESPTDATLAQTTSSTPISPKDSENSNADNNIVLIIAGLAGAVLFIILLVVFVTIVRSNKKKGTSSPDEGASMSSFADRSSGATQHYHSISSTQDAHYSPAPIHGASQYDSIASPHEAHYDPAPNEPYNQCKKILIFLLLHFVHRSQILIFPHRCACTNIGILKTGRFYILTHLKLVQIQRYQVFSECVDAKIAPITTAIACVTSNVKTPYLYAFLIGSLCNSPTNVDTVVKLENLHTALEVARIQRFFLKKKK